MKHCYPFKRVTSSVLAILALCVPIASAQVTQQACPAGTDLVAKFEVYGDSYVFEKPAGNEGIVTLTGNDQGATWTSTVPISAIILKGSVNFVTSDGDNATSGSFTNGGLFTKSGRLAGISNVQFCSCDDTVPPQIAFSMEEGDNPYGPEPGYYIVARVTDDVKLKSVTYEGDPNLQLVSNVVVSPQEQVLKFFVLNLNSNGTLKVQAYDECNNAACDDDEAPTLAITSRKLEVFTDANGDPVEDPNHPGDPLVIDARALISDNVGIVTLDFFLLNNMNVFLPDPVTSQVSPPFNPVGAQDVLALLQIADRTQIRGFFGVLIADKCNCFQYDPEIVFEGPASQELAVAQATSAMADGGLQFGDVTVDGAASVPQRFALAQNYPNPFNPSTNLQFDVPEATHVRLSVYDLMGREVAVLVDQVMQPGTHQVQFDASNLASGTYIYRFVTPAQSFTRQMILMK